MTTKEELARRALLLGLLARGFKYPDRAFQETLAQGSYQTELLEMLRPFEGDAMWTEALSRLKEALRQAGTDPAALEGEYTYLFARNVATSPYGASYGSSQARELSDVASFYAAFGFRVAQGTELPDHVGAELEFLAVLYAKEAYAQERAWLEQAETCRQARGKFVEEHLGRWLASFAERVHAQGRHPFYPALARVAAQFVGTESQAGE